MTPSFNRDAIDWVKTGGLIPAIVQDACSLRVLMLGYVNEAALQATLESRVVTFFSRSKQRLWQKGETSGNILRLRDIRLDCDGDTFLLLADPEGPTCHLGTQSCFGGDMPVNLAILADLAKTIRERRRSPPAESYTASLFEQGIPRIAQKVGEEALETALAAATGSPTLAVEAADLTYHLLVLLEASDVPCLDVLTILAERAGLSRRMTGDDALMPPGSPSAAP